MERSTEKNCVVVQHVAFEDLGTFEPEIRGSGYNISYLQAGIDDLTPIVDAELVVILGGPIGVYESVAYPFLQRETQFLAARLAAQRPTLGICLGAQLIAAALGAAVYPGNNGKELGWAPIALTPAGQESVIAPLSGDGGMVLHWHGDTFDLPAGAVLLASTDRYPNQAFAIGEHVLAFQFHPEIDPAGMERWLIGHAVEIAATPGTDPVQLRSDTERHGPGLVNRGRPVARDWLAALLSSRDALGRASVDP